MILIENLLDLETPLIEDHFQLLESGLNLFYRYYKNGKMSPKEAFKILLTLLRGKWEHVDNIDEHISCLEKKFENVVRHYEGLPTATTTETSISSATSATLTATSTVSTVLIDLRSFLTETEVSIFEGLKNKNKHCRSIFGKLSKNNIYLINERIKTKNYFKKEQLNRIFSNDLLKEEELSLEERKNFDNFIKDRSLPTDDDFLKRFLSIFLYFYHDGERINFIEEKLYLDSLVHPVLSLFFLPVRNDHQILKLEDNTFYLFDPAVPRIKQRKADGGVVLKDSDTAFIIIEVEASMVEKQKMEEDLIQLASSLREAIFRSKRDDIPLFGIHVESQTVTMYIFCKLKHVESNEDDQKDNSVYIMLELATFYFPECNREFYRLPLMYTALKKYSSIIQTVVNTTGRS